MLHDRQIDARVDHRVRTRRGWISKRASRARIARRIAVGIVVVALLGELFQILAAHFQDNYIAFVLTVLPLVVLVALVRPASGPRPIASHHRSRR